MLIHISEATGAMAVNRLSKQHRLSHTFLKESKISYLFVNYVQGRSFKTNQSNRATETINQKKKYLHLYIVVNSTLHTFIIKNIPSNHLPYHFYIRCVFDRRAN